MAIEIVAGERADGVDLRALLAPLNHEDTARAVAAERKVSRVFGASCQIPLAAHATIEQGELRLRAMVATPDGRRSAFAESTGVANLPEQLGEQVSARLREQDADAILAECKAESAAP
jgi:hydroxymethylbilane synthase